MSPKKILKISITINLLLVLLVVFFYICNFKNQDISDKSSDWGTFGDYIGGILNPLIGIMNLVVLIFISFLISDIESKRSAQELLSQKQFTLYSLKHDSLKELNNILEKVQLELIEANEYSRLKITLIRNEFNAYITTHSYLFPFFNSRSWLSLRTTIEELSEIGHQYYLSERGAAEETILIEKLIVYNDLKINFIQEIQADIQI
jgi:hypothetical protein